MGEESAEGRQERNSKETEREGVGRHAPSKERPRGRGEARTLQARKKAGGGGRHPPSKEIKGGRGRQARTKQGKGEGGVVEAGLGSKGALAGLQAAL